MEINKEDSSPLAVESYSEQSITIQGKEYSTSTIVSNKNINTDWQINSIEELNTDNIQDLLANNPEIIIFGHQHPEKQIPMHIRTILANNRIGSESMSVGAACRTFNILLSEDRNVVYAYIP